MKIIEHSTLPKKHYKKDHCQSALKKYLAELFELQNIFYADNRYSLLIILQGLDASGKDGTTRHVMTGMNPMGVKVKSFKKPTEIENSHDFLWRLYPYFPSTGMIKVFNRSYYEDILMPKIQEKMDNDTFLNRCKFINNVEEHLSLNNTIVLKFFLHISKEEQAKRIEERKKSVNKFWKYSKEDDQVAAKYDEYLEVYYQLFKQCNKQEWNIIPSDKRWYRNFAVAKVITETMRSLPLAYPQKQTNVKKDIGEILVANK